MSISLIGVMAGLPIGLVGLAMREIMGKDKFEQWLESSNYILYTNFSSENEMRRVVQAAGYDVKEWGGSLKTHLTQERSSYFWWERKEGTIVAKMSVYEDEETINRFVAKVEKAAGRKIFFEEKKAQTVKSSVSQGIEKKTLNVASEQNGINKVIQRDVPKEEKVFLKPDERQKRQEYKENFPSVYVDAELVMKILEQNQIEVLSFEENYINAEYECYKMSFTRNSVEEPFDIDIISESNKMKELYHCLNNINEEYFASVQEKTYLHIIEQIEEEGLEIEDEQVMEDNSIVITVAV